MRNLFTLVHNRIGAEETAGVERKTLKLTTYGFACKGRRQPQWQQLQPRPKAARRRRRCRQRLEGVTKELTKGLGFVQGFKKELTTGVYVCV
jgi:hypothetical protein